MRQTLHLPPTLHKKRPTVLTIFVHASRVSRTHCSPPSLPLLASLSFRHSFITEFSLSYAINAHSTTGCLGVGYYIAWKRRGERGLQEVRNHKHTRQIFQKIGTREKNGKEKKKLRKKSKNTQKTKTISPPA